LTGAPAYYIKINETNSFEMMKDAMRLNYIVTATSVPSKEEKAKLLQKGILTLQSYSVLKIETVLIRNGDTIDVI
jgi:hypothetical protein